MAMTLSRWFVGMVVACGVGGGLAANHGRAQEASAPGRRTERGSSLAEQISAESRGATRVGAVPREWQWNRPPRFVKLLGGAEPATLEESVRVRLGNQENSTVQVSFYAKAPEGGFLAGAFAGRKEVRYTIERPLVRLNVRRSRIRAWGEGPFRLVAAEPEGHTLAEFSTLGGIALGRNMVATLDEVFKGENAFVLTSKSLTFVNERYAGDTRSFPAQIVLEPVK